MGETYEVEFVDERRTVRVRGDTSILEAAEEAGLELPYQCRMGVCGVCSALRMDGAEVDQVEGMFLAESEKEAGYVLTCVATPRSDLRLLTGRGP